MSVDEFRKRFNDNQINILDVSGIFEIHLIVDPDDQVKLFSFSVQEDVLRDKDYLNLKTTCALSFYGSKPNQPMLTFWMSNTDSKGVIRKTLQLVDKMQSQGLDVKRLKVEAMAKNVPGIGPNSPNYFEFHFKVDTKSKQQWDVLDNLCLPSGAHLFFNPYSKLPHRMIPVVTLRVYDVNFESADNQCKELMQKIANHGFTVIDGKVQKELSIIDTDVFYDQGWLFKEDPRVFITCH